MQARDFTDSRCDWTARKNVVHVFAHACPVAYFNYCTEKLVPPDTANE
jgi:hypothetical protein